MVEEPWWYRERHRIITTCWFLLWEFSSPPSSAPATKATSSPTYHSQMTNMEDRSRKDIFALNRLLANYLNLCKTDGDCRVCESKRIRIVGQVKPDCVRVIYYFK